MLNQNDINTVESVIQQVIDSLVVCRQRIEELHIEKEPKDKMKDNIDLIKSSQQQFHHIINEYFKDLGENFRSLQSRYPNSEIKKQLLLKLDEYTQHLEEYAQKLSNNQFTQQDLEQFKLQNYPTLVNELSREIDDLSQYSQKTNKQDLDLLPQVKVNHRVVEGLYLTLNDYASVQWSGELTSDNSNKPIIEVKDGNKHMIVLDEQNQQFGIYNISSNQYSFKPYISKIPLDQSATIVYGDQGNVYLIGGVTQQGFISGRFNQLNIETGEVIQKQEMNVKRVGSSCILIQEGDIQYLYVVGGKTDNKVKTKLCERFNFTTQKWEYINKMNQARCNAAIAQNGDCIYIFFGVDSENQNTNSVEKYSLKGTKGWEILDISNILPGFDCSNCAAISINQGQILILGGIRYSLYFQDQMYFNRKLLSLNTTNNTLSVLDYQLPMDFIPYSQMVIVNQEIYAIGYTMKQVEEKPTLFLDGGFVIKINRDYAKIIKYIPSSDQQ